MASVPDQSGANQVQFDFKAASSLVDDILAVPATASAVMNEVSDGSTAPVPPAQSPAGSTGLSLIPEQGPASPQDVVKNLRVIMGTLL